MTAMTASITPGQELHGKVAAVTGAASGIGVKNIERPGQGQRALQQAGALFGVEQIKHQWQGPLAYRSAGPRQRRFVAVDEHHARASVSQGLGAGKANA